MDPKEPGRTVGGSDPIAAKSALPSVPGPLKSADSAPAREPHKILGRNSNGTVVLTSSPNNEAELQLYRVMQRASLLAYYDTLLEMGGDDVQQLCDAGEEEFLEIMALVGMASKPLHVRRLQKALQEWVTSPASFRTPLTSNAPASPNLTPHPGGFRPSNAVPAGGALPPAAFPVNCASPVPKEASPLASPDQIQVGGAEGGKDNPSRGSSPGPVVGAQGPVSPLQLTPVLVEPQISRLTEAARTLVKTLPHLEPKPQNTKKKICRDLENVMNMAEDDPRRMDEIRKYAAIYGRFDCKRNPQKPLTLHEVSVNEAAAQICRYCPALLTRRDELFSLARQVVRDSGYHYIKGHSSVVPFSRTHSCQSSAKAPDDDHSSKRPRVDVSSCPFADYADPDRIKRQERLEQIAEELRILGEKTEELVKAAQQVRQTNDLSSIQGLQRQMEAVQSKQTQLLLEQSELLKQPLPSRFYRRNANRGLSNPYDSEKHDTDDADSQFSLSNASSPSQDVSDSRDSLLRDGEGPANGDVASAPAPPTPRKPAGKQRPTAEVSEDDTARSHHQGDFFIRDTKIQVISASGGNIIAVANPALSMSSIALDHHPLSLGLENQSPD